MLLILTFVKESVCFMWKEFFDASVSIFEHLYHHYILGFTMCWEDLVVDRGFQYKHNGLQFESTDSV